MNERIRELALQAGVDFFNSTDPEFHGREYCESWTEQQQKFAESIVKECILISRTSTDGFSASRRMEELFGVEE